jgi:Cdc6-like AAA superfamily ATPase
VVKNIKKNSIKFIAGDIKMANRKVYIVEGIPGSGKTTTANWLAQKLSDQGKDVNLFLEGNPNHPADFESVACLTDQQLNVLEQDFSDIRNLVEIKGNWSFIPYASLADKNDELFKVLQKFDVYERSVEDFCEVTMMKWQEFAENAEANEKVYVLECCFLQNPFTFLLAKHNESQEFIFNHIEKIAKVIAKLDPVILYFEQDNMKESLDRVRKERSKEWFEFLTWYYTEQAFGQARGLERESGVLQFLEERKKLEKEILSQLPLKSILLNNSQFNWDLCKEKIVAQLFSGVCE